MVLDVFIESIHIVMIDFSQYLKEASAKSSSKNLHLEHIEDEVFNSGFFGFQRAIKTLNGVIISLRGNEPISHDISVKFDGSLKSKKTTIKYFILDVFQVQVF